MKSFFHYSAQFNSSVVGNTHGYLGLSVYGADAGATVDVPDADAAITRAAARSQDVWLP